MARLEADGTFEYAQTGRATPLNAAAIFQAGFENSAHSQAYKDANWGLWSGSTCDQYLCPMTSNGREPGGGFPDGAMRGMPCSPQGGVMAGCHSCGGVPTGPGNCPGGGEGITTTIVDLIPGGEYLLSFWQAHGGFAGPATPGGCTSWRTGCGNLAPTPIGALGQWQVEIAPQGGINVTTAVEPMPYLGAGNQVWERASVAFTAGTGATASIVLRGSSAKAGGWVHEGAIYTHSVMAVDDVTVECLASPLVASPPASPAPFPAPPPPPLTRVQSELRQFSDELDSIRSILVDTAGIQMTIARKEQEAAEAEARAAEANAEAAALKMTLAARMLMARGR